MLTIEINNKMSMLSNSNMEFIYKKLCKEFEITKEELIASNCTIYIAEYQLECKFNLIPKFVFELMTHNTINHDMFEYLYDINVSIEELLDITNIQYLSLDEFVTKFKDTYIVVDFNNVDKILREHYGISFELESYVNMDELADYYFRKYTEYNHCYITNK